MVFIALWCLSLIMFVAIWCLSPNDVCRLMMLVPYDVCRLMMFVSYEVFECVTVQEILIYKRLIFSGFFAPILCPPCLGIRSRRRGCARAASPRSRSDGGWWCWAAAADRSAWSRTGTQCAACGQRVVCKRSSISLKSSNYSYGNIKKIVYSLLQANKAISRVAVLVWKKQSGDILSIKFRMGWF